MIGISDWVRDTSTIGKLSFAVVAVLCFVLVLWVVLVLAEKLPTRAPDGLRAAVFLGPAGVLLVIGLLAPILSTLVSAFTAPGEGFVGVRNFRWALANPDVLLALGNTVRWVVITPAVSVLFGLSYAMLIEGTRAETVGKALVFIPTGISFVGAAVIWGLMYQEPGLAPSGLVNVVLEKAHLPTLGFPVNEATVTYLMIAIMVWIQTGFATVVLSAAIKAVPVELVEAARLDRAGPWQIFRRIIFPSIQPAVVVVLIAVSVATLKVFDLIKAFGAQQFGGDTLANLMFSTYSQSGLGSLGEHQSATIATLLLVLVVPFLAVQLRQMRRSKSW